MKSFIVLAVVALMAAVASAHGGGPGGRPGNRGGGPGGNFNGGYGLYSCVCGTQCAANTGTATVNYGCRKSRNQYIQCVGTACSSQTCPADQLFNSTSGVCEACPTGYHVDVTLTRCVCNQGTTYDRTTRTCITCPTDSTITADRCDCVYPAVVNKVANACQNCPTGTIRGRKEGCVCADPKQFWNNGAFACQNCPGTWVNVTKTDRPSRPVRYVEVCQCPNPTDAFNPRTVSCVTCPAGSVVGTDRERRCRVCVCTGTNMVYDEVTNTCVDRATLVRDSSSHGPF